MPAAIDPPIVDLRPRCWRCGRILAERLARPWSMRCSRSRCKAENARGVES